MTGWLMLNNRVRGVEKTGCEDGMAGDSARVRGVARLRGCTYSWDETWGTLNPSPGSSSSRQPVRPSRDPRRRHVRQRRRAYISLPNSDRPHSFRGPQRARFVQSKMASADKCPVDHKAAAAADKCPVDHGSQHSGAAEACPVDHTARSSWTSIFSSSNDAPPLPPAASSSTLPRLPTDREVSSIPRTDGSKWVYPSQAQFFAAMERKNHNPHAPDMKVIVPIHNAVNERAWAEVMP